MCQAKGSRLRGFSVQAIGMRLWRISAHAARIDRRKDVWFRLAALSRKQGVGLKVSEAKRNMQVRMDPTLKSFIQVPHTP